MLAEPGRDVMTQSSRRAAPDVAAGQRSAPRVAGTAFSSAIERLRPALLVRRERWTLTWPARLACALLLAIAVLVSARDLCRFLAVTDPVAGQFLVVEGWLPPYAYREAARLFRQGGYAKVFAAGTRDRLAVDADGAEAREFFGEGRLVQFGVPADVVVKAEGGQASQDRTFHAALSVKRWLDGEGIRAPSIDVVTLGAHARRSRLLYEKALGDGARIGVIAVEDRLFDAQHWWRSSEGVRTTIAEAVAYAYARLFSLFPSDADA